MFKSIKSKAYKVFHPKKYRTKKNEKLNEKKKEKSFFSNDKVHLHPLQTLAINTIHIMKISSASLQKSSKSSAETETITTTKAATTITTTRTIAEKEETLIGFVTTAAVIHSEPRSDNEEDDDQQDNQSIDSAYLMTDLTIVSSMSDVNDNHDDDDDDDDLSSIFSFNNEITKEEEIDIPIEFVTISKLFSNIPMNYLPDVADTGADDSIMNVNCESLKSSIVPSKSSTFITGRKPLMKSLYQPSNVSEWIQDTMVTLFNRSWSAFKLKVSLLYIPWLFERSCRSSGNIQSAVSLLIPNNIIISSPQSSSSTAHTLRPQRQRMIATGFLIFASAIAPFYEDWCQFVFNQLVHFFTTHVEYSTLSYSTQAPPPLSSLSPPPQLAAAAAAAAHCQTICHLSTFSFFHYWNHLFNSLRMAMASQMAYSFLQPVMVEPGIEYICAYRMNRSRMTFIKPNWHSSVMQRMQIVT